MMSTEIRATIQKYELIKILVIHWVSLRHWVRGFVFTFLGACHMLGFKLNQVCQALKCDSSSSFQFNAMTSVGHF